MTNKDLFVLCLTGPWKQAGEMTSYKVLETEHTVYLAFEGSNEDIDWKRNFQFWVKPYKRQSFVWFAHAGFAKAWKLARDQIFEDVKESTLCGQKRLVISGYSHGACIATLAHEDFCFHGYNPDTSAFGGARVLWMPPKKLLQRRFKKFTMYGTYGDIVTHNPPAITGYRHVRIERIGVNHPIAVSPHYPSVYMESL